jgi:hypothetical protein
MPTPSRGPGRPKSGRKRVVCRFSPAELTRLDQLRKTKARGVFLGKLIMAQPLDPFAAFRLLKK